MTLDLSEPLASILSARAEQKGMTSEVFTVDLLTKLLVPPEPRDEWERRVFSMGVETGASLTNEQLSREVIYD